MKSSSSLQSLRKKVDRIDRKILDLIGNRLSITKIIQKTKIKENVPLLQKKREREILAMLKARGRVTKVPAPFIRKLYQVIFEFSRKK